VEIEKSFAINALKKVEKNEESREVKPQNPQKILIKLL